jgi:ArsR family transcriptional regulator
VEDHKQTAQIFKAFCDENRVQILELLQAGEKCSCELLETLQQSQSGLSYHMKVLQESGIVIGRQEGKWTHYRICDEGRKKALKTLDVLLQTATAEK